LQEFFEFYGNFPFNKASINIRKVSHPPMTRACMRKLPKDTDDVLADHPQTATRGQCIYSQNNVSGTAVDTIRCGVQKSVTISENVSVFFFFSN